LLQNSENFQPLHVSEAFSVYLKKKQQSKFQKFNLLDGKFNIGYRMVVKLWLNLETIKP
jgi:hypothetical protein